MVKELEKYFHTLRYLKLRQIIFRGLLSIKRKQRCLQACKIPIQAQEISEPLEFIPWIARPVSFGNKGFDFLNRKLDFDDGIDWSYGGFGKLWCYNLNYFDYLNQEANNVGDGLYLIKDFIGATSHAGVCFEPYPTSLRIINWIKFVNRHGIQDRRINASLYAQVRILLQNLEFHLLGNHLLENAVALMFAAFHFRDRVLYRKAEKIMAVELYEQILPDGGHFELSPMYHQIILDRILDCINLTRNNAAVHIKISSNDGKKKFEKMLNEKAALMLGWLRETTFANGDIALVNDAAFDISPPPPMIREYAERLSVVEKRVALKESGYRKIRGRNHEILVDVGKIGPDYIPGHAHADTFGFLLYIGNKPVIVDTGISTYDNNAMRHAQRATRAHNTVEIDGQNQSEVWGSFRVARRARVSILEDTIDSISACHNGYRRLPGKPVHFRTWRFLESGLEIEDRIKGAFNEAVSRFHFHPDTKTETSGGGSNSGTIRLSDSGPVTWQVTNGQGRLIETTYHPKFNISQPNRCLEVRFSGPTSGIRFTW
jgi:uncharacterized heparinase superfamily protein